MKKLVMMMAALCAFGVSFAVAQTEAELEKGMKELGKLNGTVRKADPKTGLEVAAMADKMVAIYAVSKGYWEKKGVADAVKWSADGHAAALELGEGAKGGDAAKVGGALSKLGGTCKGCHEAHREKLADGTYKIK